MAKRGRPRVLDAQKRELACQLIGTGCSRRQAARIAGASLTTFFKALREDPEFAAQVRAAERGHSSVLENLIKQSETSWRAAAWLLERAGGSRQALRARIQQQLRREMLVKVGLAPAMPGMDRAGLGAAFEEDDAGFQSARLRESGYELPQEEDAGFFRTGASQSAADIASKTENRPAEAENSVFDEGAGI